MKIELGKHKQTITHTNRIKLEARIMTNKNVQTHTYYGIVVAHIVMYDDDLIITIKNINSVKLRKRT